jgi:homoserine kinase
VAERRRRPGLGFRLESRPPGRGDVPADPRRNVAARVAALLLDEVRPGFGADLTLVKKMPVGSGLGSSAASSVAALVAVNELLPEPLPRGELLRFAVEGERLASGAPHADNVAPCLLGGVCLVRSAVPVDVIPLPVRLRAWWTVVHPRFVLETRRARRALPRRVPLATAVRQMAMVGSFATALASGDLKLLSRSIEDGIAEPVRGPLIPGFAAAKEAALGAGALGCSLSGSGPSLFALTAFRARAVRVGNAMAQAFRRAAGLDCDVYVSGIDTGGAFVIAKQDE